MDTGLAATDMRERRATCAPGAMRIVSTNLPDLLPVSRAEAEMLLVTLGTALREVIEDDRGQPRS